MRSYFTAGQRINLPDAGHTTPKIEEAIASLDQIDADVTASAARVDATESASVSADRDEVHRRAVAYAATGDYADGDSPVERLKAEAVQARADYVALRAARDMRARRVFEAINAEAPAWAQASRASAKKRLLRLTTALRSLEPIVEGLKEDIGVLNMLQGLQDGQGRYTLTWGRGSHIFSSNAALEGLRSTIADAAAELAARAKTTGVPAEADPGPEHDQPWDEFGPKVRTADGGVGVAREPAPPTAPDKGVKVTKRDLADLDDDEGASDDLDYLIFEDDDDDDDEDDE